MAPALEARIAERIRRDGPIPFDAFVDAALYDADGFFGGGHGAGRAGRDFLTSPEVGPLFGALTARAVDRWWAELGRPDPFLVIDAGAGRGRLAADLLAAEPASAAAMRLVLVERSESLREQQRELLDLEPPADALGPVLHEHEDDDIVPVAITGIGPIVTSLPDLPAVAFTGVVVANELLDNLPFRIVESTSEGWAEVRVGRADDQFVEVVVPATAELAAEADAVMGSAARPAGTRVPVPTAAREWFDACAATLAQGYLVVIDYAAPVTELVQRRQQGWLRTYQAHERGESPLVAVGEQDITIDLPVESVVQAASRAGFTLVDHWQQAAWLRSLGADDLVAEAREAWQARAHIGDLEAVRHRSRVTEADALLDPTGLGAHRVLVFRV